MVAATDPTQFRHLVVSLKPSGEIGDELERCGIPVVSLGMTSLTQTPGALQSLVATLSEIHPAIVHTWMVHANLLGGLAARAAHAPNVIWSLHHSDLRLGGIKTTTIALERLNARLARWLPTRVVSTSASAVPLHMRAGYPPSKLLVLRNGVPIETAPAGSGPRLRAALGLTDDDLLVGRIARFDPQKDYATFIRAAGLVATHEPRVRFVMVGAGVTSGNTALRRWLDRAGIADRTQLLGLRSDTAELNAAFDVAVSSSAFGETSPLVLSEALSQSTPVVSTDVGDSAAIVGPGGIVVPPEDPRALGDALLELLQMPAAERAALGDAGRRHVVAQFSVESMARAYERLYREVAASGT